MGEKKIPIWKYEQYSDWSRQIAKYYTRKEIEKEVGICARHRGKLAESHLKSIQKTTSMQSNSQRRAQSGNAVTGNYERMRAYKDALEIYEFYPEKTKEGNTCEEK